MYVYTRNYMSPCVCCACACGRGYVCAGKTEYMLSGDVKWFPNSDMPWNNLVVPHTHILNGDTVHWGNTLKHKNKATHCNTLQCTATYCKGVRSCHILTANFFGRMWWLRLSGSWKLYVSFAEYRLLYRALSRALGRATYSQKGPYKRDDILQKRHIIFRNLIIVATTYDRRNWALGRATYSQTHIHTYSHTHIPNGDMKYEGKDPYQPVL